MDYADPCKMNVNGVHIYRDNICSCGKVTDIIEEDEEEYDEEGKICPNSKTGNHHFKGNCNNCYYCGVEKNRLMSLRKSVRKSNLQDLSIINKNPFNLEGKSGSKKSLGFQISPIDCNDSPIFSIRKEDEDIRFSKKKENEEYRIGSTGAELRFSSKRDYEEYSRTRTKNSING